MKFSIIVKSLRIPFLVLTPVCIFLGYSLASNIQINPSFHNIILVLLGSLFAHISVNTFNEYFDFKSGLDLRTNRTAFSGGSGALPENPEMAKTIFWVAIISLVVAIVFGIYLLLQGLFLLIPIGLVGSLIIVTYTQWINRRAILCLVSPGLGFGLLMVLGSFYALSGEMFSGAWLVFLVPFFLVNNLLLLNQYPDIEPDKTVGRQTFPIVFGVKLSNLVYAIFTILAYLVIGSLIVIEVLPLSSSVAFLPIVLSVYAFSGAIKHGSKIGQEPSYLASNVGATILTPLFLGLSIL